MGAGIASLVGCVTFGVAMSNSSSPIVNKKPSRRAAQRRTAQAQASVNQTLSAHLTELLKAYRPDGVSEATWAAIRDAHHQVMTRSGIVGRDSFKKQLKVVALYLGWRHGQGGSMELSEALNFDLIDSWYLTGTDGLADRTRNDYRSRMRKLAARANPSQDAAPQIKTLGHRSVRPGYTPVEAAAIRRIAVRQSRPATRRTMCAVVGLCQGAGLDSQDLRGLIGRHIIDHGANGIEVHVPGNRARVTWVRRDHEELVRIGVTGIGPDALILGRVADRRNIVHAITEKADLFDDAPHIEASRLRATWLSGLLTEQVPVSVILNAAGLKSARTLTELIDTLPQPHPDLNGRTLRGPDA